MKVTEADRNPINYSSSKVNYRFCYTGKTITLSSQQHQNISSGIVLPLKVVSACLITFCIFVGVRYIPGGISQKDYLKAVAGMVLLLFPFFFLHHIMVLKHFTLEEDLPDGRTGKIIVRDLFHKETLSFSEFSSIRKLNFCMYELENVSGKKVCTIHFSLKEKEFERIKELTGLKEKKMKA